MIVDVADIRSPEGKTFTLRFLTYLETPNGRPVAETVGYDGRGRGYGYGRWEEFFRTQLEAEERMKFLVDAQAVEDIELREQVPGSRWLTSLIASWQAPEWKGEEL